MQNNPLQVSAGGRGCPKKRKSPRVARNKAAGSPLVPGGNPAGSRSVARSATTGMRDEKNAPIPAGIEAAPWIYRQEPRTGCFPSVLSRGIGGMETPSSTSMPLSPPVGVRRLFANDRGYRSTPRLPAAFLSGTGGAPKKDGACKTIRRGFLLVAEGVRKQRKSPSIRGNKAAGSLLVPGGNPAVSRSVARSATTGKRDE